MTRRLGRPGTVAVRRAGCEPRSLAYHDRDGGQHRFATFDGEQLAGALFVARRARSPCRAAWAAEQLAALHHEPARPFPASSPDAPALRVPTPARPSAPASRRRQPDRRRDRGRQHERRGYRRALKAGTNCGSCRAEIKAIIQANHVEAAE